MPYRVSTASLCPPRSWRGSHADSTPRGTWRGHPHADNHTLDQEKTMKAGWIIPFIILGGSLQTIGAAMNGQLGKSLQNPWLVSAVSFALITFFFTGMFFILPHPLPSMQDITSLPWWAAIGGLAGAVQVYAGLRFVNKVGAGPFVGFIVSAALITSLVSTIMAGFAWSNIRSMVGELLKDFCL